MQYNSSRTNSHTDQGRRVFVNLEMLTKFVGCNFLILLSMIINIFSIHYYHMAIPLNCNWWFFFSLIFLETIRTKDYTSIDQTETCCLATTVYLRQLLLNFIDRNSSNRTIGNNVYTRIVVTFLKKSWQIIIHNLLKIELMTLMPPWLEPVWELVYSW